MNIVLVGMPASGKTTVSKILGEKYGLKVIDTDEEIVKKHGSINGIFADYGEKAFRDMEAEAVKEVSRLDGAVISTGGGCPLRKENVENLKKSGKIVYLNADIQTLIKRTRHDTSRPLLKGDAAAKIRELFAVRAHVYKNCADIIIDTDEISAEETAERIMEVIRRKDR